MTTEPRPGARNACPHCGKPPGLRWWHLLPSSNSRRVLTCAQCGGKYDTSDLTKTASILGGLLCIGPGVYLLGTIVKQGHHAASATIIGTLTAAGLFVGGSLVLGLLTQRLVSKS